MQIASTQSHGELDCCDDVFILVVIDVIVISGVNDVICLAQCRKISTAELMIFCLFWPCMIRFGTVAAI